MTELMIPDPGPERIRFVEEHLTQARQARLAGEPESAVELLTTAIRAGLWSHSRLWAELRQGLGDTAYAQLRTLWLESPRRCHRDVALLQVVAGAAATATEHEGARALLRKAILRQGYRRRRLRARLRRTARASAEALGRSAHQRRCAAALAAVGGALTELGARPFLIGETLRRHLLGLPLARSQPRPRLELGVLATEAQAEKLEPGLAALPELAVRRPCAGVELLWVEHAAGVRVEICPHQAAADGRLWREAPAVRWWYPAFGLAPAQALGVPCYLPEPAEGYLTEGYPDWRAAPADFDPRLDAPNVEVTDPEYLDTLTYTALLEAMASDHRPAYQRYVRLLRDTGEGPWLDRLRLGTS